MIEIEKLVEIVIVNLTNWLSALKSLTSLETSNKLKASLNTTINEYSSMLAP